MSGENFMPPVECLRLYCFGGSRAEQEISGPGTSFFTLRREKCSKKYHV